MTSTLKTKENETLLVSNSISHLLDQWAEGDSTPVEDVDGEIHLSVDDCLITLPKKKFICSMTGWNFIKNTVTIVVPNNLLSHFSSLEEAWLTFFGKKRKPLSSESIKEDNQWKVTVHFEN